MSDRAGTHARAHARARLNMCVPIVCVELSSVLLVVTHGFVLLLRP